MSGSVRRFPSFLKKLLDLIYPPVCFGCGSAVEKPIGSDREGHPYFCSVCWNKIERIKGPRCPICAVPFASPSSLSHSPGHHCAACREDPPDFQRAVTPFNYEGTVAKAIQLLKYQKKNALAAYLAALLHPDLISLRVDLVTAIPIHPRRLRLREFNQSLLLAREIAARLSSPLSVDALERDRDTPPQVGLSKKEREKNVKGAFRLKRAALVQDKRILLVDDVYTTGATLKEGAKTLMKGGAKEVIVAAVARML